MQVARRFLLYVFAFVFTRLDDCKSTETRVYRKI